MVIFESETRSTHQIPGPTSTRKESLKINVLSSLGPWHARKGRVQNKRVTETTLRNSTGICTYRCSEQSKKEEDSNGLAIYAGVKKIFWTPNTKSLLNRQKTPERPRFRWRDDVTNRYTHLICIISFLEAFKQNRFFLLAGDFIHINLNHFKYTVLPILY